ncbi:hypothetical protein WEB32_24050 [Streptomyces netropsis]|uniref:Uncharacterized protein n=1 Tax=Streptomyces netropsis TaxID=55404 RepID=A0A7W7L8L0_STRNE|nr:hypothetical protein [Streptomyces netropsis]MBB4885638.1 hypothetical protein [Streptomyces netropsis]GGR36182.1 hypothetical protein GCM10010219_46370 [Streptomyces netropsis]
MGAVSCGTPGSDAPPKPAHPVFDAEQSMQLLKAREVTRQSGLARFTSTLVVGSAGGDAVETTRGEQDFGRGTAYAERTLSVPEDFPDGVARQLEEPGKETFAVVAREVLVRDGAAWLRFRPTGVGPLSDATRSLRRLAGETAPYGGTLAEVIASARPQGRPSAREDGGRDYRASVPGGVATAVLGKLGRMTGDWNSEAGKGRNGMFPMEVRLDARGRVTRATMDLTPLLRYMRDLDGVRTIRATYELSGYGARATRTLPDPSTVEDATKTLTLIGEVAPGDCALFAPGLASAAMVRTVSCARKHDLRVFGQALVGIQGSRAVDEGAAREDAVVSCREQFREAPEEWLREAVPAGRYRVTGGSRFTGHIGASGKSHSRLRGQFTCYVRTSEPAS